MNKRAIDLKGKVAKRIVELHASGRFRRRRPLNDPTTPADIDIRPASVCGKASERLFIAFRTPSCGGSCTMCGFGVEGVESVTYDDLIAQFAVLAGHYDLKKFSGRLSLCTESDAFFGVPLSFWEKIAAMVCTTPVREVDMEATPVHAIRHVDSLRHLQELFGKARLYIGMGLETHDDYVRNMLLRKNLPIEIFEEAVEKLAEAGIGVYVYILLKPPGLNEKEAIEECIRTVSYFFDLAKRLGAARCRVTLKPLFIPRETIAEALYNEGLITPPKLWSLIEVIKQTHQLGTLFVPLFDEGLAVDENHVAHNCSACTPKIREAMHKFNATQKIEPLLEVSCNCKGDWQTEVGR